MNPYTVSRYLRDLPFEPAHAPERLTWHDGALCAQADPDEWFPEKGGSILQAKAICRRCPVREPCLGYALDRSETHGVWGGLSHEERLRIAGQYEQGASLPAIIAFADADCEARRTAASERQRETAAAARAIANAAYAARHAALRAANKEAPQPREAAA